jgi:glucosamine--fructose-6-phosphate aminotransferase (isomerizing)
LEYRGYDSAGLAVLDDTGLIKRARRVGKIKELENFVSHSPVDGSVGIAHARWATHGIPTENNAHPHMSRNSVAVVHNGIIENHHDLRQTLKSRGFDFQSETDTEVIAHQIQSFIEEELPLLEAVMHSIRLFEGSYAIGVISVTDKNRLIAARNGSPLVIGLGEAENFIASDVFALLRETHRFIFLEDGDIADIHRDGVDIYDARGRPVQRSVKEVHLSSDMAGTGKYRHYMLKEIHEQPLAVRKTLEGRTRQGMVLDSAFGAEAGQIFDRVEAVSIVACGTSNHAALVAKQWMESIAHLPCSVEVASEFRYREHVVAPNTLFVSISQSGETADTLAALKLAKQIGFAYSLAICNVPESSIVRESDATLLTRAGQEIGVASTKAFTTQLTALLLLVSALARRRGLSEEEEDALVAILHSISGGITRCLDSEYEIRHWASLLAPYDHAMYLGRGTLFPIALEGALKLKEISYIHAEAYPAGELKHGPLALIDQNMPVVALAPNNETLEKIKSNLQEVSARGGRLYVFTDSDAPVDALPGMKLMRLPRVHPLIAPIIYTVPLQLLAYHVAVIRGTDLDQPRNLAKSVTVE